MAEKKKVDDSQLVSMVNQEVSNISTETYTEISQQRIDANKSFTNSLTGTTAPTTNMSAVKMYFTPSVVNTLTMHLSKVFCSKKETVQFNPTNSNKESVVGSKQLGRLVNDVLHKKNNGFNILTEMFRSAAVNKNAIAKITWGTDDDTFEEEYSNIDEAALYQVIASKEAEGYEVEVVDSDVVTEVSVTEIVDELTGVAVQEESISSSGTYRLRMTRESGRIDIDVIPPEEFLINEDTTSINDDELTRFVGHRKAMYRGDVQAMFPDVDVDNLPSGEFDYYEYEETARHEFDGTDDNLDDPSSYEPTSKVTIVESWIRADRDGDGFPEWRHVFTAGNELLMDEEWFGPLPFASFTFFPVPHKFYGLSVYDRLRSYEETATSLVRAEVDMARLKNTFRLLVKDGTVDMRALQSGKPGGIRVSNTFDPNDVMAVPSPQGSGNTMNIISELRRQVIADIGIDPISGQISTDIEKSGNDAEKTAMAYDNASVKMEGYSRSFADGTLRDIIWLIASELVKHKDDMFVKEMLGDDPIFVAGELGLSTILKKTDISAQVGLGHQTGPQKIAALTAIQPMIAQLEANPTAAMYHLLSNALEGFGYEHPETVLGPLELYKQKAQQMQQMQAVAAQTQQIQQQQIQQTIQLEQAKFEYEKQIAVAKAQAEMGLDQAKVEKTLAEAAKITTETRVANEAATLGEVRVVL